jgi:TRAP-type C4-dicarboxylate transport system permease small subunit
MSQRDNVEPVSRIEMYIINVLKVCQYIGVSCILLLMTITVINSIGRYGFSRPVLGVIEISDFLLLISAFLVGAYTMVTKSHVTIGIIVDRFSPRTQAIVDSFTYLFSLIMVCLAGWRSLVNGLYIMQQRQATDILHIPHFPFYMVVAFGWFILGIAILLQFIRYIGKAIRK